MKEFYSVAELSKILNTSVRAIRKRANKEEWKKSQEDDSEWIFYQESNGIL